MAIEHRIVAATKPNGVMYHVTNKKNLPSIQKNGLLPAKKPAPHTLDDYLHSYWAQNSIYFTSTFENACEWTSMLNPARHTSPKLMREFVILEVDVKKWVKKFVKDRVAGEPDERLPDWDGFYLVDVIVPPANIKKVIPVDDKIIKKVVVGYPWNPASLIHIGMTDPEDLTDILALLPKTRKQSLIKKCQKLMTQPNIYKPSEFQKLISLLE